MHPVNTDDFGVNGITITYNPGPLANSVATGHIVKQIGLTHYVVVPTGTGTDTANSAQFTTVRLATKSAEVSALPIGVGTIEVSPFGGGTEHARKIFYRKLLTVEGHTYYWRRTMADQQGECNVAGSWQAGPDVAGFVHTVNV